MARILLKVAQVITLSVVMLVMIYYTAIAAMILLMAVLVTIHYMVVLEMIH